MARTRSKTPQPTSVVASAARITAKSGNRPKGNGAQPWQEEAWGYLDTTGELHYVVSWKANAMSRVTLRLMHIEDNGDHKEVTDPRLVDILHSLVGGESEQRQMLATMTAQLEVPGESYLVGVSELDGETDVWRVLSNDECQLKSGMWQIDRGDGNTETYPDNNTPGPDGVSAIVIRIWRPHPRKWVEADSPVRSALPILRELNKLTMRIGATIDSRLSGAGIFAVPSEMTFQTPPALVGAEGETPYEAGSVDDFLELLTETISANIMNPTDAEARTPIIIKAPGQYLSAMQHITFDVPFDAQTLELRTEAIRRLALTLDTPPEVLLGNADSNHFSAWLSADEAITNHIEPLAELITSAITKGYLWPTLIGEQTGLDGETIPPSAEVVRQAKRYYIDADTSELRQRPNRSAEALELHARMVISDAALMRETGFEPGDTPAPPEVAHRLLLKAAAGTLDTGTVVAALNELGLSLPEPASTTVEDTAPSTDTATGLPSRTTRDIPTQQDSTVLAATRAGLLAVSEVMVHRAVERASNRIHNGRKNPPPMSVSQADVGLKTAWVMAPRVAALHGVDPDLLQNTLDGYTRDLLQAGGVHDSARLGGLLDKWVLSARPDLVLVGKR